MASVSIQGTDFDVGAEIKALAAGRHDIGAVVTFIGLCRDESGTLAALELEHYPGMAEDELARVLAEAETRWPLLGARIVHRCGKIAPGEQIVLALTASAHRASAFAACDFLMDYLKTRAPFWKKQHRRDGSSGEWVAAKDLDDTAAQRWALPS